MIRDVDAYFAVREELRALEWKLAERLPEGHRSRQDVDDLVLTWRDFGPDFGSDDRTLLQDYVHFLLVRDRLQQFMDSASAPTRAFLESLTSPYDEAFKAQTLAVDSGLVLLFPRVSGAWWWRVTPRSLGRELRRQFTKSDPTDPQSSSGDTHQR